ncbi:hypothetical protein WJX82_008047 [Trebouxia sp. C0006]
MNIGDHKGAILDSAIQQHQPKVAIELGTYIGYSAIRIAQQLPSEGKLYSMDPDETHVQLAKQIIDHAGVSHKVEVIQGTLQTSTEAFRSKGVHKVDFVCILARDRMKSFVSGVALKYIWEGAQTLQVFVTKVCSSLYLIHHQS